MILVVISIRQFGVNLISIPNTTPPPILFVISMRYFSCNINRISVAHEQFFPYYNVVLKAWPSAATPEVKLKSQNEIDVIFCVKICYTDIRLMLRFAYFFWRPKLTSTEGILFQQTSCQISDIYWCYEAAPSHRPQVQTLPLVFKQDSIFKS